MITQNLHVGTSHYLAQRHRIIYMLLNIRDVIHCGTNAYSEIRKTNTKPLQSIMALEQNNKVCIGKN